jgi:hypothetical protein
MILNILKLYPYELMNFDYTCMLPSNCLGTKAYMMEMGRTFTLNFITL